MTRIVTAAALSIVLALMGALIVGVFMAPVETPTGSTIVERAVGRQPVPAIRNVEYQVRPGLNLTDRPGMPFLMVVPAGDGSPTIELRRCCQRDIVAPMPGW
jgi:hypothetical protein